MQYYFRQEGKEVGMCLPAQLSASGGAARRLSQARTAGLAGAPVLPRLLLSEQTVRPSSSFRVCWEVRMALEVYEGYEKKVKVASDLLPSGG